jgi:hypothetical protein
MAAPNPEPGDLGDREDHEAAPEPASRPELPDADVEARWADLVEQLGDLEARDAGPELPDADHQAPDGADASAARIIVPAEGPRDWPATPEVEALEESESHFTPPEPEPVLSRTPLLTLAWVVVVAVPLLTVVGVIVRALVPSLAVPGWLGPAGGLAFLSAVAVLVWRMPHRRDPDDTGNGAVV